MINRYTLSFTLLLAVFVVACERNNTPYAAKKDEPYNSVNTGDPAVSAMSDVSVVRSVLPQGDEGINGEALFVKSCTACHQINGNGVPGVFPPLVKSPYVIGDNVDRLASIILYGLQGPINVLGTQYNGVMSPWGVNYNDEELAAIATYIRSAWGNQAAPVSATVFSQMRQKWGTRGQFSISELGEEK
jgi:mono/diheme cytochrome c family protein